VLYVTSVLFVCYCKQYVMAIPQYDILKQLSVSHESYHSDYYIFLKSWFFLPSVGCAVMTTLLYFPFNHVGVWTSFVWLMTESLNMVWPSAIIFCKRRVICFGVSFVLVIL
jgi:hypothetical protein